ncbi:MAG: hypothetical protein HFI06_12185 [Eubacterium sp.]|mgnify:CR=1 FL=1|jgi:hypothetical protein|nr:hypothetical protein [Eubacterium sp.]NBI85600.1 hypothetical protein [Lachnospiraceae bacterium]
MGKIKKLCYALLIACILVGIMPQAAEASSLRLDFSAKTSGAKNSIKVKSVKYKDTVTGGYQTNNYNMPSELEIDFLTRVSWKPTAKVTSIKDNKGKSYHAYLSDLDDDECDIMADGLKRGRTYTIVIDGIKPYHSSSYCKLTIKVKLPTKKEVSKKVKVAHVEVEEDGVIDVKFASKVIWKWNAKITSIKDNKGKSYKGHLIDRDDDECEIYINKMKYGRTYNIKISGIKPFGASAYDTITVKVKVPVQNNNLFIKKAEYDADYDDGRMEYTVSFDFNKNIAFKGSSYVLIKDMSGKAYSSKSSYVEWDDDECEVHLSEALQPGREYSYEIVNVKAVGAGSYATLKGKFIA